MNRINFNESFLEFQPLGNVSWRLAPNEKELRSKAYALSCLYSSFHWVVGESTSLKAAKSVFGKADFTKSYFGTRFSMWQLTDHLVLNVTKSGAGLEVSAADRLSPEELSAELDKALAMLPQPTTEEYHFMGQPVGSKTEKPSLDELLNLTSTL